MLEFDEFTEQGTIIKAIGIGEWGRTVVQRMEGRVHRLQCITPVTCSPEDIITEKGGGWLLQATVSNSYQLRWWLRGYGERVEVLGPKVLRQEFAETAVATAKRYTNTQG